MLIKVCGIEINVEYRKDLSTDTRIVLEAVSPGDGGRYRAVFLLRDGEWRLSAGDSHHTVTGRIGVPDDLFRHFLVARKRVSATRVKIADRAATNAVKTALAGTRLTPLPKGQLTFLAN